MSTEYWNIEVRRLLLMILGGVILGYFTGNWLIGFLIANLALGGWMMFKLRELQHWLEQGQPADLMPDNDGIWESITYIIHRKKQGYETQKQKQQELALRFNNIMSALPDAQILLNSEHLIQWANRSAQRLVNIDGERDAGQRIDNLIRISKLSKLLNTQDQEKEIRFQSPYDDTLSLSARLFYVQPELYLLSIRDISQRIQLNNMRRSFIANASHELRTPLTVITGYLELFEDDPEMPAHLLNAIQQARGQGARMQQITSDMLTLSHLENSERKPKADMKVDVAKLLENAVTNLQKTIASDSHTLHKVISSDKKVMGITKDITSVVNNLIENAIKHTPDGSSIHARWTVNENGMACFSVEDDGPGIPQQHLEHLTERFYRVDKGRSRDKGGTGLGLAIAKHVMLNHDGHLTIESEPGRTVFTACFPPERLI